MTPKRAIQQLRRSGMTQVRIAAAVGCTQQAISLILRDRRKGKTQPIADRLTAMARALPE